MLSDRWIKGLVPVIFVGMFCILYVRLGSAPIYILDEARNAECAREMLQSKNGVVPTFNGALRTDKPPLHYYFMILGYRLFGVNAWGARFFSALMGMIIVFSTWFFTSQFLRAKPAFWALFALSSSLFFCLETRFAVPDPYFICFLTLALFFLYAFHDRRKTRDCMLFYAFLGLATLAKGPVAIVLAAGILLLFLWLTKNLTWKSIASYHPLLGAGIVLTLCVPWYVRVHLQTHGEWTRGFFLDHNLGRFVKTREGHHGYFVLGFVMLIAGMLPFSLFSFQAARHAWKARRLALHPFLAFCLASVAFIVIFFAFSATVLPNYTEPAYPFLAILIGSWINEVIENKASFERRRLIPALIAFCLLTVILFVGVYMVLNQPQFSDEKGSLWFFIGLPLGGILAAIFVVRKEMVSAILACGVSFLITAFLFLGFVYPTVYAHNPVQKGLVYIDQNKPIGAYFLFNPAFRFYLKNNIPVFTSPQAVQGFLMANPDGQIITRKEWAYQLQFLNLKEVFIYHDTFEIPETIILKNK